MGKLKELIEFLRYLLKNSKQVSRDISAAPKLIREYLVNGKLDYGKLLLDFLEQKNLVTKYFTSDLRKAVDKANTEEAHQLGFKEFHPNTHSVKKLKEPANVKFFWVPNSTASAAVNIKDKILGNMPTIKINLAKIRDPKTTTFHEFLHVGSYGEPEPKYPGETLKHHFGRWVDTGRYYKHKTGGLLKGLDEIKDLNMTSDLYEYIADNPHEAAANYFHMGRMLGIEPGQEYPGDEAFESILGNISKLSENSAYRGKWYLPVMAKHDTSEERLRLWKAMNGTYFSLVPFAAGIPAAYYAGEHNNENE